ncbi:MAG: hypothetical protein FJ144_13565 [Deltaproteobacteria bacterium]|nr:hypothetical protein [Deltaproteobacteria bacterium]
MGAAGGTARPARRWLRRFLVVLAALLAVSVALVAFALRYAGGRLPELLHWAAAELLPGFDVRVGSVDLDLRSHLDVRDLSVSAGTGEEAEPLVAADRLTVRFAPLELLRGRVEEVRAVRPIVCVPAALLDADAGDPGAVDSDGSTAFGGLVESIGRFVVEDGRLTIAPSEARPEIAFSVDLDVAGLGADGTALETERAFRLRDVRVGRAEQPLLVAREIDVEASFDDLRRARLGAVNVVDPVVTVPADPAAIGLGAAGEASATSASPAEPWSIERLRVESGVLRVPGGGTRPEVTTRFSFDLREIAASGERAEKPQEVQLRDVRIVLPRAPAPFLALAQAAVVVTPASLLGEGRIDEVEVGRGALRFDAPGRAVLSGTAASAPPAESATPHVSPASGSAPSASAPSSPPAPADAPWSIGTLAIAGLDVLVADLGPPLPDFSFVLRTTLHDLPLSAAAASIADESQRLELADLALFSPFDPFKKVVTVGSVFVGFSLAGVMRSEITEVTLLRPTIFLSEDLFWYMTEERRDVGGPNPWTIELLRAELGNVLLEIGKATRVGLPITFHTEAKDVRLDNLADLEIAAELEVPRESYRFPAYDLALDGMRGDLHFAYPPGSGAENVVSVLRADVVEWRDYRLREGWLSLTFDTAGISGTFGGSGYAGYVNGGVTIPYQWGQPWNGWLAASDLDLKELSTVATSDAVGLTGPLNARLTLVLVDQTLESALGDFTLKEPGRLEITKLDESMIPASWPGWQRDLGRIAITALRDFDYTSGKGDLRYGDRRGFLDVDLEGPRGGRRLEARYHGAGGDPLALDVKVASRQDEAR